MLPRRQFLGSGTKEKAQRSLFQRVETTASFIELLLETLKHLSDREFVRFRKHLIRHYSYGRRSEIEDELLMMRGIPLFLLESTDMQDTVFLMVNTCKNPLEMIMEILDKMKRTDLVQRLSDSSSGPRKKHLVDEHLSGLILKVATMMAVKELLLETLNDLTQEEQGHFKWFLQFAFFQRSLPQIPWRRLLRANWTGTLVNVLVETCGQQSVDVTREVLMDMNRTDLVQRLSESSSGFREKNSLYEHWPALIQKVETMVSIIESVLETLGDWIWTWNFKDALLSKSDFHTRFSDIPFYLMNVTDKHTTVFLIVQTYGQQSMELIKEILNQKKKTDLLQMLSNSSSGPKKKHSADKHPSTLIHRVATIAAVKQLLLETLSDLSNEELEKFKEFLQLIATKKDVRDISMMLSYIADRAKIVDQMVQTYGQQSVELTREVFMDMKRPDLVQRLAMPSPGPKAKHSVDEHPPALLERAAATAAVKKILLETLNHLDYWELVKLRRLLRFTYFQRSLPQIPRTLLDWADTADLLVDLMVESHDQQSVEVTKEVLMDMNRTDLVQRLSKTSSGLKEKHQSKLFHKETLLETLEELSFKELEHFKWLLQDTDITKGLPRISRYRMEMANSDEIVELMAELYGQQSVEMTRKVLKEMNRSDLVQRLSDISSGSKGSSRGLELGGCGSLMQESSGWTKLEPEVNRTGADGAPTYRLQSEAGNFECSVSGLRWFCKGKVSFKYQFCSWEEPMERVESLKYMPAGPLIDITVIAGKLDEVYLPHWICIDDSPKISDKFAVLHINDCGDDVEKVSEVTTSHVKLSEPVFSPRAVLMKVGIPVKINCNVLIYKTNTAFLTLHVYLVPRDPGLQQAMDKRELSYGYKVIRKPHPEKSLKMRDHFILTADLDGAEIYPQELRLRYEARTPNFFEVFVENPNRNFVLKLAQRNEQQAVWTCAIRKDEYQSTGHMQAEHFVDKHQCDLIERVSNIGPILDKLLQNGVIQREVYDIIRAIPTTQEKMRTLYCGPLKAGGPASKDIFYKILEENESYLVADLKRKEA